MMSVIIIYRLHISIRTISTDDAWVAMQRKFREMSTKKCHITNSVFIKNVLLENGDKAKKLFRLSYTLVCNIGLQNIPTLTQLLLRLKSVCSR